MKNKAAIALQCESNVKLIAALLFILYSRLIWWDKPDYGMAMLIRDWDTWACHGVGFFST